jgi:hypothetical protein
MELQKEENQSKYDAARMAEKQRIREKMQMYHYGEEEEVEENKEQHETERGPLQGNQMLAPA